MRPYSPFYRRLRPHNYAALALDALTGRDAARHETAILRLVSNDDAKRRAALPKWTAWARERPVTRANALRQLAAAARFRASGMPPDTPVLVLASTRDRLVDAACSRALALAWNAPLIEHPRAGHDLPLDDGPWAAATIARWWVMRNGARNAHSSGGG